LWWWCDVGHRRLLQVRTLVRAAGALSLPVCLSSDRHGHADCMSDVCLA
jgi:hypothetical protein